MKKKILYVTAEAPYGKFEPFIISELVELKKLVKILVVPRTPKTKIFHNSGKNLVPETLIIPLINIKILSSFIYFIFSNPFLFFRIFNDVFLKARNILVGIKNLIVFPKAAYLSFIINKEKIIHMHAHWGSTPSTIGYILNIITKIPWSFTLHRGDIIENNILKEKIKSVRFVRLISLYWKRELLKIIGNEFKDKMKVLHMGVKCDFNIKEREKTHKNIIAVPATLSERKGHEYLIDACSILVNKGIRNFIIYFYGEGPLEKRINRKIKEKKLEDYIKMLGMIQNDRLLEMYGNRKIDFVVLPSLSEGIPVSLMEAMAYEIPVIATDVGGVRELVENNGILIREKNPKQLADAIEKLLRNKKLRAELGKKGKRKVIKEFNIKIITKQLLALFENEENERKSFNYNSLQE